MAQNEVTLSNEAGLHARPAQQFVQEASKYVSEIRIIKNRSIEVDAKSILGVMSLGLEQGDTFSIKAEGEDADQALAALTNLVENQFKAQHSS